MMKELPSLSEVYGILVQEQIHQGVGRYEEAQEPTSAICHTRLKRENLVTIGPRTSASKVIIIL